MFTIKTNTKLLNCAKRKNFFCFLWIFPYFSQYFTISVRSVRKNSRFFLKNSMILVTKLNEPVVGCYTSLPKKWSIKKPDIERTPDGFWKAGDKLVLIGGMVVTCIVMFIVLRYFTWKAETAKTCVFKNDKSWTNMELDCLCLGIFENNPFVKVSQN